MTCTCEQPRLVEWSTRPDGSALFICTACSQFWEWRRVPQRPEPSRSNAV